MFLETNPMMNHKDICDGFSILGSTNIESWAIRAFSEIQKSNHLRRSNPQNQQPGNHHSPCPKVPSSPKCGVDGSSQPSHFTPQKRTNQLRKAARCAAMSTAKSSKSWGSSVWEALMGDVTVLFTQIYTFIYIYIYGGGGKSQIRTNKKECTHFLTSCKCNPLGAVCLRILYCVPDANAA